MLKSLAGRVAGHPRVYDLISAAAGARRIRRRLSLVTMAFPPGSVVLDVGGGTGLLGSILPPGCLHVCLDTDAAMLGRFLRRCPHGLAVLGDAARLPIAPGSVDVVALVNVSHHLGDDELDRFLAESGRVLREGGAVLIHDAVWDPGRRLGRLLWKYDRGSHPRPVEEMDRRFSLRFRPVRRERYRVLHSYVIWVGEKH